MEELKIGDLVETCQFLPGFITSINGDDVEVFIPSKHDFNNNVNKAGSHSIKHCGVHKIDSEYAMKLFLIGEDRLKELWNDKNSDNFTWEEIVHNEYLKLRKSSKNIYTKLLYTANEIYMNPDYKPGEYIKIIK